MLENEDETEHVQVEAEPSSAGEVAQAHQGTGSAPLHSCSHQCCGAAEII